MATYAGRGRRGEGSARRRPAGRGALARILGPLVRAVLMLFEWSEARVHRDLGARRNAKDRSDGVGDGRALVAGPLEVHGAPAWVKIQIKEL